MQKFESYINSLDPKRIIDYAFFISKKLDSKVELYKILHYYNIDVSSKSDEEQIECKLPSHYGIDRNKSARYYAKSDSGVSRVYCFKCNSTLSAFWYFHKMEKNQDLKTSQIILKFTKEFGVDITDDFYDFQQDIETDDSSVSISLEIEYFRNLKFHNMDDFKRELFIFIKETF